jgi:hypothetical protein
LHNRFPNIQPGHKPRVLHVHGAFKHLDKEKPPLTDIAAQAAEIRFVLETRALAPPVLAEARDALAAADAIYSVGFAFYPLNCELLDLSRHSEKLFALNYDGHRGLQARLDDMGIPEKHIWKGAPGFGNGIDVATAAQQGFFELKPPAPTRRSATRRQR